MIIGYVMYMWFDFDVRILVLVFFVDCGDVEFFY